MTRSMKERMILENTCCMYRKYYNVLDSSEAVVEIVVIFLPLLTLRKNFFQTDDLNFFCPKNLQDTFLIFRRCIFNCMMSQMMQCGPLFFCRSNRTRLKKSSIF